MATRFESYTEAIRFLNEAADAIEQAHACMKDAGIEAIEIATGRLSVERYIGIGTLSARVTAMEAEVRTAECDECGHALSKHGDQYGCEHDRGDVSVTGRDGHSLDVAAGPCGCEWGQVDPAKIRKAA